MKEVLIAAARILWAFLRALWVGFRVFNKALNKKGPWPAIAFWIVLFSLVLVLVYRRNVDLVLAIDCLAVTAVSMCLKQGKLRGKKWEYFLNASANVLALLSLVSALYSPN